MKKYYIYKHTTPNGKVYIGQTCKKPEDRWANGYGYKNQMFYNAIQKYGWGNIIHEVLYSGLTKEEADQKEIELISYYDSTNPNKGYNIAFGGGTTFGVQHSEDTRRKISEAHKGIKRSDESILKQSKSMMGHIHSEETKKKIGEANSRRIWSDESREKLRNANLGKVLTEEHKKKIGKSSKGRKPSKKSVELLIKRNKERIWTDESRRKISEANKGKPAHNNKKIICVETNTIYNSTYEAGESLGINRSAISMVCNGKRKTAGGYHWQFLDLDSNKDR